MPYRKAACTWICFGLLLGQGLSAAGVIASNQDEPSSGLKIEKYGPKATLTEASLNEALSKIESIAQKIVQENKVPGLAISVVFKDKLVFAKGFGVRAAGTSDKVDADTVFQLASVSKPLASAVVASLVDGGKISWDSKISQLDPGFEMYDPWVTRELTLRDLFSHRSGLPDHAGDLLEDIGYDRSQVLYRLRYQKPASSMRSKYAYTNFGLTEAAVAAAKTYKKDWEDLSEEKLYKALGMNSTSSRFADFEARSNKALGHVLLGGKWMHKFQRQPDPQSPAGGASSSVNDMAKWMRLEIAGGKFDGKQIISASALQETQKPQICTQYSPIDALPEFYGLGFNVGYDLSGRLRLGHSGGFSLGAATAIKMIPSEDLGICVLTNTAPIGIAEAISSTFTDLALEGKETQDWFELFTQVFANPATTGVRKDNSYSTARVSSRAALKNDAYTGKFSNDFFGDMQVSEKGGGLVFAVGPVQKSFPLKHFDGDTFTYETESEDLSGISGVRFSVDGSGKAASVLVENFNEDGQGLFVRKDLN